MRACGWRSEGRHVAVVAAAKLRLDGCLSAWYGNRSLVRLVADKGDDHAVEVEEEHDQVEAELDERFLKLELADRKSVV